MNPPTPLHTTSDEDQNSNQAMPSNSPDKFRAARRDRSLAVLEGFHTLKHALRFGADVSEIAAVDLARVQSLASDLAPDVIDEVEEIAYTVSEHEFSKLSPHPHPTGIIAIAKRPSIDITASLKDRSLTGPTVVLDQPRNLANVGAAIRVAAAAGVRAVITRGDHDPWDPAALRGSAGLHYALPVGQTEELPQVENEVIAIDPTGDTLEPASVPTDAILIFGSERYGLSRKVLATADRKVSLPMSPDVSSLNLATTVAAVLYVLRFVSDEGFAPT